MSDGDADWGLYKNPLDTIGATLAAGQDRAFLQQQRQAAIAKAASDAQQQAASAAALPGIRAQVGTGDYDGARISAAFSGNQPIGDFIGGLQKEHQAKLADMAGTIGSVAYGLKNITDPAARAAAFDAQAPALKMHGITDADLAATRANLTDQALDGYIDSAQTVRQHVEDAQTVATAAAKANAPYTLAPGEARYDAQGHQIARSDFKPDVTFVPNGDGTQTRVITNLDGSGGGPTPSPASAGISRPQRNNNPGNVKALDGGQMWRGQTGTDDQGYAVFGDQASGQRAADRNLQSYARRGINTVSGIISRWAPKADRNNTDAYIASVSRALGVQPNQPLDLTDPNVRQTLLSKGIYPNEGPVGRQPNAPHPSRSGDVFGTPATASADGSAGGMTAAAIDLAAREGLAHGGTVPPGYSRNKAVQAAITNRMAAINAGGDVQGLINRGQDQKGAQAMVVDMARGASGKTVQAGNVAVEHLAQLHDAAVALGNGNVPAFNRISLMYQRATGSALPTTAEALRGVVANEIQKAVSGSAGALHDREDLNSQLTTANSPAQMQGIIKGYIGLMGSQMHGVRTRYEAATGRQDFSKYVSPIAAKVLGLNGGGGAAHSPAPGTIVKGYRFKGGNPADQASWERAQ